MDTDPDRTRNRWWPPTRGRVAVVAVLSFALYVGIIWYQAWRFAFEPRNWGEVEPGVLYRSGQMNPRVIEDTLREHGIEVIVDLDEDQPGRKDHDTERAVVDRLGIRKVDLTKLRGSGRGDYEDYVVALGEMVSAARRRTPCLVHCAAGSQRTGGAVALYRMFVQDWTGDAAYAEYRRYGGSGALESYFGKNLPAIAERLAEAGVIARVPAALPVFAPHGRAVEWGSPTGG